MFACQLLLMIDVLLRKQRVQEGAQAEQQGLSLGSLHKRFDEGQGSLVVACSNQCDLLFNICMSNIQREEAQS